MITATARRLAQRIRNAWHRPRLEARMAQWTPPAGTYGPLAALAHLDSAEAQLHAVTQQHGITRAVQEALADYRGAVAAVITAYRREVRQ